MLRSALIAALVGLIFLPCNTFAESDSGLFESDMATGMFKKGTVRPPEKNDTSSSDTPDWKDGMHAFKDMLSEMGEEMAAGLEEFEEAEYEEVEEDDSDGFTAF